MADPQLVQSLISELPANVGAALAIVPALEWAKRSPWLGWVNIHTAPYISAGAAALAALGIHGTFDSHGGVLTITGLTVAGLTQGVLEVGKQWLGQHWTYRIYQSLDTLKSLAVALNNIANIPTRSIPQATGTGNGAIVKP